MEDEGVDIAIAIGVGIILYVVWGIACHFIRLGFVHSGIQSKQLQRKTALQTQRLGSAALHKTSELVRVTTHEADEKSGDDATAAEAEDSDEKALVEDKDDGNLSQDEKDQIVARSKTLVGVIRSIGMFNIHTQDITHNSQCIRIDFFVCQ